MPGASQQTRRVKILNANWVPGTNGDGRFDIMIVTEDDQRHLLPASAASVTAVVALAFGNSQPAVETIVAALKESPYDTGLDLELLFEIAEYWEDVRRKKKAVSRRNARLKAREAHKAAGPREGTPAVVKEPGRKKIQQGLVVSSKTDKTITLEIEVQEAHRIYKKVVRHTKKLTAHDERNDANEGDTVRVIETRPMSKTKRWRLVEVVERAK